MSILKFNPDYWSSLIREGMNEYPVSNHIVWMPGSTSYGNTVIDPIGEVCMEHGTYFNFMVHDIDHLQEDKERSRKEVKRVAERLVYDTENYLLSELGVESISDVPKDCRIFFYINKIMAYPTQLEIEGIKGMTLCGIVRGSSR